MNEILSDKKIAIIATNGFEESELLVPKTVLDVARAMVDVVSLEAGTIKGWKDGNWAGNVLVDKVINEVSAYDYDCLLIPGGVINPDQLRKDKLVVSFVNDFIMSGKPIAAICHGPQLLIETGALKGKKITSYLSIKTDLINAGADWVDEEVVEDNGLVTSRSPADLDAFCKKMIEVFARGIHYRSPGGEEFSITH